MIITRTPLRISFFGGGTDYPAWYEEHGGSVLNATINKYCYIYCRYLPPFFHYKYLVRYMLREERNTIEEINHPSARACLQFMKIAKGVEIVHMGDIPARSGVGSSSAFTVGLLNALNALLGQMVTKRKLAADAIHVEQKVIAESVGSQDQVAVTFGGFNRIDFSTNHDFIVTPVTIPADRLAFFQSHLMLFFTGFSRNASEVAAEQIKNTKNKLKELKLMKEMVDHALEILNDRGPSLDKFGKLLHESWKLKRSLTHLITTGHIDQIYDAGIGCGALGGKLLGAGGGGFMLFFAPPETQAKIREKLKDLIYVPFSFESLGSQVILYATQDFY
jgi:D-glycero-alpha-D-manno-heptose-7-phosphate kinase